MRVLAPNYDPTKVCFAYFGASPGNLVDKAKTSVPDYPKSVAPGKPKNLEANRVVVRRCANCLSD
jgi:hypothetical protein